MFFQHFKHAIYWVSMVCFVKSFINLIEDSFYMGNFFLLLGFCLSLSSNNLITMCFSLDLFELFYLDFIELLTFVNSCLSSTLGNSWLWFLQVLFLLYIFSWWNSISTVSCVFDGVPQVPQALLLLHMFHYSQTG